MFKANVVEIKGGKFAVQLYLCPGSDEMIECLLHAARLPSKARAQALADKIQAAHKFDPAFWVWVPTPCSPYSFMHTEPTAIPYDVR